MEAACLGHDLGHPPFGHTGEQALAACMKPHGGFEGNAQTFRIVTRLEEKSVDYEGLDLTRATLLGLIKYPFERGSERKKYLYADDAETYRDWLYEGSGTSLVARDEERIRFLERSCAISWTGRTTWRIPFTISRTGWLQASCAELWTRDEFVESIWRNVTSADIPWKRAAPSRDDVREVLKDASGRFREIEPVIHKDVIREVTRYYIDRFANAGELEPLTIRRRSSTSAWRSRRKSASRTRSSRRSRSNTSFTTTEQRPSCTRATRSLGDCGTRSSTTPKPLRPATNCSHARCRTAGQPVGRPT